MAGSCQDEAATGDQRNAGGAALNARKVHKADREKLRRDKLNEQFTELASIIDPVKPKHDKASILGDSLQVVRDLRNEIRRLRLERGTLFDESKDLKRETDDLEEERLALKKQTEELGVRLNECLQAALSFTSSVDSQTRLQDLPIPYYAGLNNLVQHRPGLNPFVYLTTPSSTAAHVERPCAQYASLDTVPDFLSKVQASRGLQPFESDKPPQEEAAAAAAAVTVAPLAAAAAAATAERVEEDDSDVRLQLGQPHRRNRSEHAAAAASAVPAAAAAAVSTAAAAAVSAAARSEGCDVVDTDLQLKVPVSGVAHGGGP